MSDSTTENVRQKLPATENKNTPNHKYLPFNLWLTIAICGLYYIHLFENFDPEITKSNHNVKLLSLRKSLEHNYQNILEPVFEQLKKANGSIINKDCNMMLQHGHWESLNWTLIPSSEATENRILRGPGFKSAYSFQGEFQADSCDIVDYTVEMMKKCFGGEVKTQSGNAKPTETPKTYWHLVGDSRTRVIFRGLNARLEQKNINDHRVHGTLKENSFIFHWSRFYTEMGGVLGNTKFEKNSSLIIGEQFLHLTLDQMLKHKSAAFGAAYMEDLLEKQIVFFNETVMKLVLDDENIDTVVVFATEGLEAKNMLNTHSEYSGSFVKANKYWTAEMWIETGGFYNQLLFDCVKHWQEVDSRKYSKKLFWMTNNRKTGRYEQTVSGSDPNAPKINMTILLPDGVHKIAHDKNKKVPDSVKADTNMLYNLFCNKKLKPDDFEEYGMSSEDLAEIVRNLEKGSMNGMGSQAQPLLTRSTCCV